MARSHTAVDGLEAGHQDLAEQGHVDRVVGVVVAQYDVCDIDRRYAQLLQGVEDRHSGWHHSRVDHDDAVTVPDQTHGAGDPAGCVAGEEHVQRRGAGQTFQIFSSRRQCAANCSADRRRFGRLAGEPVRGGLAANLFPDPREQVRAGPNGLAGCDSHEARLWLTWRHRPPVLHRAPERLGEGGGGAAMPFAVGMKPVGVPQRRMARPRACSSSMSRMGFSP